MSSSAHVALLPRILDFMKKRKMTNVLLCGGGVIPPEDVAALNKKGIGKLFGPGTDTRDIVAYLNEALPELRG